jgi:hypothetical protein
MSDAHGGGKPSGFQLPGFSTVEGFMQSTPQGVHITWKQLATAFAVVNVVFFIFTPTQAIDNYQLVIFLSPLWIPILLYQATRARFAQFTRMKAFSEQKYMLLEIRVPRDTTKTPFAMETVIANLHVGSGENTFYKTFFQGGTRPWWSFEIVSLGGRIHLYVWVREGYRKLVESYFYGQYPDVEIIEAEDYSLLVDPSQHGYNMFACEFGLAKPDPNPLKTYVDYKIEPGDKPEETVDPLGQLIETLSVIGPGEEFWIQIMFRQTKKEKWNGLVNAAGKPYGWTDAVKEATEAIRSQTVRKTTRVDPVTGAVSETESFPNPSKGQSEGIAAIERKASKQLFDVGIRAVYLAPEDIYQGIMIPGMLTMFKPFNSETGNSITPISRWSAFFNDLPWEDRSGHHKHQLQQEAIRMYRRRAYFYDPYIGPWMNLSTEELASIFHIPSAAVTSPNLPRIQSATSGAPSNLPT